MIFFIEKHQELINNLLLHHVDFIVIGGYSVIFHGYARTTGDIDIWLRPTNDNKVKLLEVFRAMDFFETDVQPIADMDFTGYLVFSMWEEPEKVDFITKINLVEFEVANERKIVAEVDDLKIPFLHLDDLLLSKFNTGRLKDKADIEELQQIQKNKKF